MKNSYIGLIILMLVSIVAGLYLIISPDTVKHWVIRGVGLIWMIEGIGYALDILLKHLKSN